MDGKAAGCSSPCSFQGTWNVSASRLAYVALFAGALVGISKMPMWHWSIMILSDISLISLYIWGLGLLGTWGNNWIWGRGRWWEREGDDELAVCYWERELRKGFRDCWLVCAWLLASLWAGLFLMRTIFFFKKNHVLEMFTFFKNTIMFLTMWYSKILCYSHRVMLECVQKMGQPSRGFRCVSRSYWTQVDLAVF